jgi:hypothetical protein
MKKYYARLHRLLALIGAAGVIVLLGSAGVAVASSIVNVGLGGTGIGYPGGFFYGSLPIGNGLNPLATSSALSFATSTNTLTTQNLTVTGTCTGCGGGGSGSWPFTTTDTNFGVAVQSTTTPPWFKGSNGWGLFASSTSVFTNASTTNLTVFSNFFLNGEGFTDLTGTGLSNSSGALTVSGLTTTQFASANISQWTNNSNFIALTALSGTFPISYNSSTGVFSWLGIGTSSAPTIGNLAYWTAANTLGTVATTSASCSGSVSCTAFNVLGSSPITITGTDSTASSTALGDNNTFSGNNQFTASSTYTKVVNQQNASTSLATILSLWLTPLGTPAGAFLAVDPNGKVIATTTPSSGAGTVTSVSGTFPIVSTGGTTPVISFSGIGTSSAPTIGNLAYWTGANSLGTVATSSESCSSPLSCTGFNVLGTGGGAITIANAAADGSTKGAASFASADFNDSSGNISTDYTNGQAASASAKGYLTSADWLTFNGKLNFSNLFNIATTYGTTSLATTTAFWFQGGLNASSTPSNPSFIDNITGNNSTTTNATTTSLAVSSIKSALHLGNANGSVIPYGGATTCTNQFFTAFSAAGASTCTSVTDSAFSGQLGAAHGGTNKDLSSASGLLYFTSGVANTVATSSAGIFTGTQTNGFVLSLSNGTPTWVATSSSGGSPAGSGTEFQYRNGSSFGAITNSSFSSTGGWTSFGTTTPLLGLMTLGSSTAPELMLTDNNPANNIWALNAVGGNLYLATSTAAATSTNTAFSLNGVSGLATFANGITLTTGQVFATAPASYSDLAKPQYSFSGKTNYGLGLDTFSNVVDLIVNGVADVTLSATAVTVGSTPLRISSQGTAAAPALQIGTSGNTGLYGPGGGTGQMIGFTVSGVESARFDGSGAFGIGSTTPWAMLSIATSSPDYSGRPIIAVATSSDPTGFLFGIFATSSTMARIASAAQDYVDSGVRILIGAVNQYGYAGGLDQLFVNGRMNTGDWSNLNCETLSVAGNGSFTTDTTNICGPWQLQLDTSNGSGLTTPGGTGVNDFGELKSSINDATMANNGAMLTLMGPNAGALFYAATSTPVIEALVRINTPLNATSSFFYLGFSNQQTVGTAFETEPTNGCYFEASSTKANWQAVCKKSSGSFITQVDTGIASSTSVTATGEFMRLRVEFGMTRADFYIQKSSAAMIKVASITGSPLATTTLLSPVLEVANTTGGLPKLFDFQYLRLWWRRAFF